MRVLFLSDSHGNEEELIELLKPYKGKVDLLCHSGDICAHYHRTGSKKDKLEQVHSLIYYWNRIQELLNIPIIICPGNHCFWNDEDTGDWQFYKEKPLATFGYINPHAKEHLNKNIYILNNSSIEINNIKFHGLPHTPYFHGWNYNFSSFSLIYKEQAEKVLNNIPEDTQVLLSHGPPRGILDLVRGEHVGCKYLKDHLNKLKSLKICSVGHLHNNYGIEEYNGIKIINCAIVNDENKICEKEFFVVEI